MPEHLIRLRGGWERLGAATGRSRAGSRSPWSRPPSAPQQARLARWFQTPPLDPRRETLWLRLDSVPGLVSVSLNDREIARRPFPAFPLILDLVGDACRPGTGSPSTSSFPSRPDVPAALFPWGEVALLIRADGPAVSGPAHVD